MFSPSHLKNSQHPLPVKSSSSTSALSSMKMKNLIHTLIVSQVCRIIRAVSKVKAAIVEILIKDTSHSNIHYSSSHHKKRCSSKTKKIIMGSFRLHYNWCSSKSSHVIPVPSRVYEGLPAAEQQGGEDCCHDSELAGYLQWLEENGNGDGDDKGNEINDVDMLAEMFIANCHEKFRLEKQESDRRLQEMLARSM